MTLTIIATPGSASANSFVTAAEMTAYCEGRLNASLWVATTAQQAALVEATRDLTVLGYVGSRVTTTQALTWPREWAYNPDMPSIDLVGNVALLYYANTVIPARIKDATCELALQYLVAGTSDLAVADTAQRVIEKTIDVLTTKYDDGAPRSQTTGLQRFTRVMTLLEPLLLDTVGALTLARM